MAIVVGFIATAEGRAALDAAIVEAQRRSDRLLVIVHGSRGADEDEIDRAVDEARDLLDTSGVGFDVRHLQRGNDVAEALMGAAEEAGAELIVIGLRRRSPLGKLILGSNAQRILLDAPCHVLAVKPAQA
ncbi:universal stress protein [Occultella gossypii]|uniref:Universal stress protein n=1 Tax=Occultella gossypii TaxID=2800820 RepID=A0ABS7S5K8_9MICO|nr:universal stress protein [Occultella gossypii]MBZ2195636.1 universal stress protein [Occultella gossypii]